MTAAVFVGGVVGLAAQPGPSAHRRRRRRAAPSGPGGDRAARFVAGIVVAVSGHFQTRLMFEQQPMKMAAAEALCDTETGPGLSVFAVGDVGAECDVRSIVDPEGSLVPGHRHHRRHVAGVKDLNAQYQEQFGPGDYRPNLVITYWAFRAMIRFGAVASFGAVAACGSPEGPAPPASAGVRVAPLAVIVTPFLANAFGWIFTEMGRQPWVVAPNPTASPRSGSSPPRRVGRRSSAMVLTTLVGFTLLYGVLWWSRSACSAATSQARMPTHDDDATSRRPGPTARPPPKREPTVGLRLLIGAVMELTTFWFILIGVLWIGYFFLEGFDFGVGMLLHPLGRTRGGPPGPVNTIGPVWDGNEVWLLTAGGATFAAFPNWYATLFSGFYLALFLILVALILRGVAFEYRGKVDSATLAGPLGPGHRLRVLGARGAVGRGVRQHRARLPIDARRRLHRHAVHPAQPVRPPRRLVTASLFALHGANFLALKTEGEIRDRARGPSPGPVTRGRRSCS